MHTQPWVLITVDTAGLAAPLVVEVAAQRMLGWQADGPAWHRYVHHGSAMSDMASRQHGVTRAQLERDGDAPLDVHEALRVYVGECPVVAFDHVMQVQKVLHGEWMRLGVSPIGRDGFCALRLMQRLLDPMPVANHKLDSLRSYYMLPEAQQSSAAGELETAVNLLSHVVAPLVERRQLGTWADVQTFAQASWYPSRLTFGEFKGRAFREAHTDPKLHAWLVWLSQSSAPRSASMGRWYLAELAHEAPAQDDALPEVSMATSGRTSMGESPMYERPQGGTLVFVRAEVEELKALIASARLRLAELEARYTQERHEVEVTQARLFGLLRTHYQQRDRLRLLVDYRRQYLDALLYEGEEAAEAWVQQCEEAQAQTDADYEQVAAVAAAQKTLPEDEAKELKRLWRKLVRLFHPDRFAHDPQKLSIFQQLTSEINQARDNGNVQRLREIAQDPNGFLLKQGWGDLDFSDSLEAASLRRLYEALQLQIVMTIEASQDMRRDERYELHKLSLERAGYLEEVAQAHVMAMADELQALADEAKALGLEIEALTGQRAPGQLT